MAFNDAINILGTLNISIYKARYSFNNSDFGELKVILNMKFAFFVVLSLAGNSWALEGM